MKDKKPKSIAEPPSDLSALEERGERLNTLIELSNSLRERERRIPITFHEFLDLAARNPTCVFRDIFQLFHDMIHHYVPEGTDDFQKDKDWIGFADYDCHKLFVEECDNPFFADRLFANRLMRLVEAFRKGTQKTNIFLFEGPPGSGKSTFLNNLLQKLEEYTRTEGGATYKVYWRLNLDELGGFKKFHRRHDDLARMIRDIPHENNVGDNELPVGLDRVEDSAKRFLEFSCPNHDHPIWMIPKSYRQKFLDELISDEEFKKKLFTEKQYEWVRKGTPCNICSSLYNSLLDETGDPFTVFGMINARKNIFSRQLGECVSVFNPGDMLRKDFISSPTTQGLLNNIFKHEDIRFIYSYLAKTNNGVLALMDIKGYNVERLRSLHGIISDGVHKVDLVEETVNTLFLGLINPADKKHYDDMPSFRDRIITVNIPYILDYNTEIEVYRNKFGKGIDGCFLPGVLDNFAKIIIATRLDSDSPALRRWIKNPMQYTKYVDKNLLLLKMDIYTGRLPSYLSDDDIKRFDRATRKDILAESETQGDKGVSGRQSLLTFAKLLARYAEMGKMITMESLKAFVNEEMKELDITLPDGFIESLIDMYDYNVIQELKEAIYYFNEEQITTQILDYLFAINFEPGSTKVCPYTGNTIEITDAYLDEFETAFMGTASILAKRREFRLETQKEYVSQTVAQEMRIGGKKIKQTKLFNALLDKYNRQLKENSLKIYQDNETFRRAIQDFSTPSFNAYSDRLRHDVNLLLANLQKKFGYSAEGAQQICFYVLDKGLIRKY